MMLFPVLLAIPVTQKHRAQDLKTNFRKKEGRSSLQRLSEFVRCSHWTYREIASKNRSKTPSAAKVRLANCRRYADGNTFIPTFIHPPAIFANPSGSFAWGLSR